MSVIQKEFIGFLDRPYSQLKKSFQRRFSLLFAKARAGHFKNRKYVGTLSPNFPHSETESSIKPHKNGVSRKVKQGV